MTCNKYRGWYGIHAHCEEYIYSNEYVDILTFTLKHLHQTMHKCLVSYKRFLINAFSHCFISIWRSTPWRLPCFKVIEWNHKVHTVNFWLYHMIFVSWSFDLLSFYRYLNLHLFPLALWFVTALSRQCRLKSWGSKLIHISHNLQYYLLFFYEQRNV